MTTLYTRNAQMNSTRSDPHGSEVIAVPRVVFTVCEKAGHCTTWVGALLRIGINTFLR